MLARLRYGSLLSVAWLLLVPTLSVAAEQVAATRPNVVLITLDTTRADRLGCYGAESAATPNLDRLAAAGVRFDQVQSPAPLTVPSHSSMMTGLVPRRHGAYDNALYPLPEQVPVLAELLSAEGYDTAAFVSSVVLDRRAGLARGFRHYDDSVRVGQRRAFNYEERAASQTNASLFEQLPKLEPPFFLWVHYFDPHLPYVAPPPYGERFAKAPYDGEVAYMDSAIGALLGRVRERFPGSLIVVAGDHGESLGEHGEEAHGVFIYQSTQRVPLIVAGPKIPAKKVVSRRVGLVDVMPTVLALSGIAVPAELDGRSLLPLIRGDGKRWQASDYEMENRFPSLAYDWAPLRALVRGDLVLIDAPRAELYDLAADPEQRRNLGFEGADAKKMLSELRRRTPSDETEAEIDPEAAERRMRLTSLGYAAGFNSGDSKPTIDPKDGIELLRSLDQARAAIQHGRAGEAVGLLTALLEKNPGNISARLALVAAQLGVGEAASAVATAREALRRSPEDDLVRFNLANALAAESRTRPAARAEACEQYEQTLLLNPRRADAYLNYASLLVSGEEPARALEWLKRAEAAGVEDPDLAIERALLELLAGRRKTAIHYLEQALRLNPHASDAAAALDRLRAPN